MESLIKPLKLNSGTGLDVLLLNKILFNIPFGLNVAQTTSTYFICEVLKFIVKRREIVITKEPQRNETVDVKNMQIHTE